MSDCNGNARACEQRAALRKWSRRFGSIALGATIAFGGWHCYGVLRRQHLTLQTEQFVARGEFQSAALVARRLLELDPDDVAASRAMAEMAEKAGRAEAIEWRRKVASLEPKVASDQLALAKAALQFAQIELAERVLGALPDSACSGVSYHQLAGAAALARKQLTEAERHFAAALQAAPGDPHLVLNLALIRLASADANVVEQARLSLIVLADEPAVRVESLRALTADALARKDRTQSVRWATQLNAEKDANFPDALLYFQAVEGTDAAAPTLAALQAKAAAAPETTAELIIWMNRHGLAQVATNWRSSLPAKLLETQPVPLAMAESFSFRQDWNGLRDLVEGKDWGHFESLRLAVESHALHRLSPPERPSTETQTVWRAALKAAQTKPEQLLAIAHLAEGWGYQPEAEEAWWMIANSNDSVRAGLTALQRLYQQKQDTRGLLRVAKRAVELNPADLIAANNCASLGLLVSDDSASRRLALKLHTEHPSNHAFAATCAFAFHTEGKSAEGLKILETLKEEELRNPAIAAYYVVMLVDNGKLDRARSFLADAKRAVLLPEEQQLLTAATHKLLATGMDRLKTSFVKSS